MQIRDNHYIFLLFFHALLGIAIYEFPFIAKIYAFLIIVFGIYFVIKNKNKNNEVLYVAGYLVGSEVFLRSTGGNPSYEFVKYSLLLFIFIGMFYSGIPKKPYPYWTYLLLLIPSVLLAVITLDSNVRQNIIFDISGPICLGICSLYTYKRKITIGQIDTILIAIGLPIVACCAYLFLKCPILNVADYITNTESNFTLSGGYAPNQMATTLGLGMFVFFLRSILVPSTKKILTINLIVTSYIYYRGLLTFSRGGTITGILIIMALLFSLFVNSKNYTDIKLKFALFCVTISSIFILTSFQTDGLLLKRYANQNPSGLYKSYEKNGREDLALEEIKLFKENPVLGIGVGEGKQIRKSELGSMICSHSEMTRMLAEHGSFGMLSLLILIITPLVLVIKNKQNIYFLSFFGFWLLTINHSGMRIAAPALLYALTLLHINFEKEDSDKEKNAELA